MRHALAIAIMLVACGSLAAKKDKPLWMPVDKETGEYAYKGVVQVEGTSADELYGRAMLWAAHAYRSAQDVVQLADKDHGRIVLKGNVSFNYLMHTRYVGHAFTIEVKDGRYRYQVASFTIEGYGALVPGKSGHGGYAKRTAPLIQGLLEGLKTAMTRETADDDW